MKLERYKDKKETRKKVILINLTVITLIGVTMVLYKTFANFRTSTSFQIMSGNVVYKKKGKQFGTDIPLAGNNEDGLYKVEHSTSGIDSGWNQTEYRYAGANPDNYVYFNCSDMNNQSADTCEKWRIIGLVNVKMYEKNSNETKIEQRIKIIRNESIGNYAWDRSSNYSNDWTKSGLKDMLNDGYYSSLPSVTCYTGNTGGNSSPSTCDFSSNPKGLTSLARDMIDNQVVWNLGGSEESKVKTNVMYEKERGVTVYSNNQAEWTTTNDSTNHKGVGLMYPSDYGYAVGGNVRSMCLGLNLSDYNQLSCYTNNWLYIGSDEWLLSTWISGDSVRPFYLEQRGFVFAGYWYVNMPCAVRPTVYLNKKIGIGEGEGNEQTPFQLLAS